MDFALTGEQKRLKDQIIRFSRKHLNKDVVKRDAEQIFSRDLWEKCGEMGLQGLVVPEEYGGIGLDALSAAMALEAFGYGCSDGGLVFSISAHLLACVVPIWRYGSEHQKKKFLPGLISGEMIAVNGMTEPGSGSDAFAMKARADKVDGGYVLNGTKIFASNGTVADLAVVFALTDKQKGYHGGISAFLIERGAPGFSVGQKFDQLGLRTCPICELVLEDVRVDNDRMLGQEGSGAVIFSEAMEWERICLVAAHIGTMERLMEQAVEHAKERKAFGGPIGKNQAVSHKIAEMKVRLEAARLLTYRAAWGLDNKKDNAMDASIAKLFTSESLVKTAVETVQIFGGYGFMKEYEIERALRDAIGSTIYSGTSEIQKTIIAKWLGL
jgi:alkylation response protein AidB-like acyl-CoA dehydrogenase